MKNTSVILILSLVMAMAFHFHIQSIKHASYSAGFFGPSKKVEVNLLKEKGMFFPIKQSKFLV